MKNLKKLALKAISSPNINMKKVYRAHRKFINFLNPPLKPLYKLFDHEIEVDSRKILVRIFYPKENQIPKVLIFVHGGGWVAGNIDSYTNVCANMANETRHTVVSIDYRLAPEHPYPAGLKDCYQAIKEIFEHVDILGCTKEDITLIGDSAGANLVAAVSLLARERGDFRPKRQILIYPATYHDHSENSPFPSIAQNGTDYILTSKRMLEYMDMYVPNKEDRANPYIAPILAEDLSDQPDTLIITAEYDPLRDEGEAYGIRLKRAGNYVKIYRVKNTIHGFFALPWGSSSNHSYKLINWFISH